MVSQRKLTILIALVANLATCHSSREGSRAAYEEFRQKYGRSFKGQNNQVSYTERHELFQKYRIAVENHNAQPGITWEAAVNQFADYTDTEFRSHLGYVASSARTAQSGATSSFLETRPGRALSETVDWSANSKAKQSGSFQRNQGGCGSCWAVAAVGALEMHAELAAGPTHQLSFEQLVDCTPNPESCGGKGGCQGATVELAFQYVKEHGLVAADQYQGYLSNGKEGKCKQPPSKESTHIDGFRTLPINKLRPLMEALSEKGPVAVSVAAEGWQSYAKGVFNGCSLDAVVNHAVLMVGYGRDAKSGKDHFLIRNSWGAGWGEKGHIRLERHSTDEGAAGHCGTDHDPKAGVGCDNAPESLPVCGMCGVLSDSAYPQGVRIGDNTTA